MKKSVGDVVLNLYDNVVGLCSTVNKVYLSREREMNEKEVLLDKFMEENPDADKGLGISSQEVGLPYQECCEKFQKAVDVVISLTKAHEELAQILYLLLVDEELDLTSTSPLTKERMTKTRLCRTCRTDQEECKKCRLLTTDRLNMSTRWSPKGFRCDKEED